MRLTFADAPARFIDVATAPAPRNRPWAPVVISGAQIAAEAERLAEAPMPETGHRSALIAHPDSLPWAPGLAPGIQVTLTVLRPGESSRPFRHNATEVSFCIAGEGVADVGDRQVAFSRYDVWNIPSYVPQSRSNTGSDLQVCLTYSNAPLLQVMQVYLREDDPPASKAAAAAAEAPADAARQSPYGVFEIGEDGAMLMPYERLINPPAVTSPALHWSWRRVEAELEKLEALGSDYVGRRLYLLYNPMTGRTNGTTPSFFATMTIRPPNIVDRPHRHVSAAINYYFQGEGRSSVAGNIYEWKAGDLMLSAPGWVVHNHASYGERVYELTVQDQPLNIAMESLLWQESMREPPVLLGAHAGFNTNRAVAEA